MDLDRLARLRLLYSAVYGVLSVLAFSLSYRLFAWLFSADASLPQDREQTELFIAVVWLVLGVLAAFHGTWAILSVRWIRQRVHRKWIEAAACMDIMSFPIGTWIGIQTLRIVQRPEIRSVFKDV